jgi:phosphatidate phosphatase APP1
MIVLFPTYARRLPEGPCWRATVAGMVARPLPENSRRRVLAVAVLKRLLDLDGGHLGSEVFRRRVESFFFQRIAGQPVQLLLDGKPIRSVHTDRAGHFEASIDVVEPTALADTAGSRRFTVEATAEGEDAAVPGSIHLVDPVGLSVISDIDDTVKITNVADRRELLRNTLLREFAAVPGMADIYRRWHDDGTVFHYVSASPWQLSRCLCGFLDEAGLPAGSMHLKLFRLKDSTPLGRLPSRKRSKRRVIEKIMDDFPDRRFLLVGDSGERDPEVYANVARRRGPQVAGIAIRLVESRISGRKQRERMARLARRLPEGGFRVFHRADELVESLSSPPSADLGTHQGLSKAFW